MEIFSGFWICCGKLSRYKQISVTSPVLNEYYSTSKKELIFSQHLIQKERKHYLEGAKMNTSQKTATRLGLPRGSSQARQWVPVPRHDDKSPAKTLCVAGSRLTLEIE